jgi:hypothetical protein
MLFKCRQQDPNVFELGLVTMDAKMNMSPYKTLFKLLDNYWDILGIEHFSVILSEGVVERDKKLIFHRVPIG